MARTGRVHSLWSLALWLIVAGVVLSTTPRTAQRFAEWRKLRTETADMERTLAHLRAQEQSLEQELRRVQTDLGRESLARQRGWLRKGEEPLRIDRD
ncbi:MAG: hypothetical protein WHS44_01485 [Fimbriimonadales bacterium]|nr:MAG: hypothetical protein KatS3mg018_0650 [Fimbriimonadales bacterium]